MRKLVLALFAVLIPVTAHADQCALNSQAIADKAVELVKRHKHVLEYCEPCREKEPGAPYEITTIENKRGQLFVNGRGVDLAYFYVKTTDDKYRNVGIAVGCGAERVTEFVKATKPVGQSPAPRGPRPPTPPLPPPPPPRPRPSSADDLIGNWSVKVTTKLSTCSPMPEQTTPPKPLPKVEETWTIDVASGTITIQAPARPEITGPVAAASFGSYRHLLNSKQRPSSTILQVIHSEKDRFWGTLVRAESVPRRAGDPHCVALYDIWATKIPTP